MIAFCASSTLQSVAAFCALGLFSPTDSVSNYSTPTSEPLVTFSWLLSRSNSQTRAFVRDRVKGLACVTLTHTVNWALFFVLIALLRHI